VGHSVVVAFRALDGQYFPITVLGCLEITGKSTAITQIAQGRGEFTLVSGNAVIGYGRFPGRSCLESIAAVEIDASPVFVLIGHDICLESTDWLGALC
jgi:hypothetical protein